MLAEFSIFAYTAFGTNVSKTATPPRLVEPFITATLTAAPSPHADPVRSGASASAAGLAGPTIRCEIESLLDRVEAACQGLFFDPVVTAGPFAAIASSASEARAASSASSAVASAAWSAHIAAVNDAVRQLAVRQNGGGASPSTSSYSIHAIETAASSNSVVAQYHHLVALPIEGKFIVSMRLADEAVVESTPTQSSGVGSRAQSILEAFLLALTTDVSFESAAPYTDVFQRQQPTPSQGDDVAVTRIYQPPNPRFVAASSSLAARVAQSSSASMAAGSAALNVPNPSDATFSTRVLQQALAPLAAFAQSPTTLAEVVVQLQKIAATAAVTASQADRSRSGIGMQQQQHGAQSGQQSQPQSQGAKWPSSMPPSQRLAWCAAEVERLVGGGSPGLATPTGAVATSPAKSPPFLYAACRQLVAIARDIAASNLDSDVTRSQTADAALAALASTTSARALECRICDFLAWLASPLVLVDTHQYNRNRQIGHSQVHNTSTSLTGGMGIGAFGAMPATGFRYRRGGGGFAILHAAACGASGASGLASAATRERGTGASSIESTRHVDPARVALASAELGINFARVAALGNFDAAERARLLQMASKPSHLAALPKAADVAAAHAGRVLGVFVDAQYTAAAAAVTVPLAASSAALGAFAGARATAAISLAMERRITAAAADPAVMLMQMAQNDSAFDGSNNYFPHARQNAATAPPRNLLQRIQFEQQQTAGAPAGLNNAPTTLSVLQVQFDDLPRWMPIGWVVWRDGALVTSSLAASGASPSSYDIAVTGTDPRVLAQQVALVRGLGVDCPSGASWLATDSLRELPTTPTFPVSVLTQLSALVASGVARDAALRRHHDEIARGFTSGNNNMSNAVMSMHHPHLAGGVSDMTHPPAVAPPLVSSVVDVTSWVAAVQAGSNAADTTLPLFPAGPTTRTASLHSAAMGTEAASAAGGWGMHAPAAEDDFGFTVPASGPLTTTRAHANDAALQQQSSRGALVAAAPTVAARNDAVAGSAFDLTQQYRAVFCHGTSSGLVASGWTVCVLIERSSSCEVRDNQARGSPAGLAGLPMSLLRVAVERALVDVADAATTAATAASAVVPATIGVCGGGASAAGGIAGAVAAARDARRLALWRRSGCLLHDQGEEERLLTAAARDAELKRRLAVTSANLRTATRDSKNGGLIGSTQNYTKTGLGAAYGADENSVFAALAEEHNDQQQSILGGIVGKATAAEAHSDLVVKALSTRTATAKDTMALVADLSLAFESAPIGIRRLVFSACASSAADPTRAGEWALSSSVLTVDPSGYALDTVFATMMSLASTSPFGPVAGLGLGGGTRMSLASTTALASAARRYFMERGKRFGPAAPLPTLVQNPSSASARLVAASDAVTARVGAVVRSNYQEAMQGAADAIQAAAAPHLLPGQTLSVAFHATTAKGGSTTLYGPTAAPSFFASASDDADGLVAGLLRRCLRHTVDGAGVFSAPTRHAYLDKKKGWPRPCGSDFCAALANAAGGFSWIGAVESSSDDDADTDGSDADAADILVCTSTAATTAAATATTTRGGGGASSASSLSVESRGASSSRLVKGPLAVAGGLTAAAACFSEATLRYPTNATLTVAGEGASAVEWRRERDAARAAATPVAAKHLKDIQRTHGSVVVRAADLDPKILVAKRKEQRAAQRKQFEANKGGMGVPNRAFAVCMSAGDSTAMVLSVPADGSSPAHLHRYAANAL